MEENKQSRLQNASDTYKAAKTAADLAGGNYAGALKEAASDPGAVVRGVINIFIIAGLALISLVLIVFSVPVALIKDVNSALNTFAYQTNYNEVEIKVTDIYQDRFTELRKEAESKAYNICYADFLKETYGKSECYFVTDSPASNGIRYPPKVKIKDDCPLADCDVTQNLSMILAAQQAAAFKDPLSVINRPSFDAINDDTNGLLAKIKNNINSIMYIDYAKSTADYFIEEHEIVTTDEDGNVIDSYIEYWYYYTFNYYVEDLKESYYYHNLFKLSDKEIEFARQIETNVGDIARGSVPTVYESIKSAIAKSNYSHFTFDNEKALIFPTEGSYDITGYFGMRYDPITIKPSFHTGLDVVGFNNILSAGDGVVVAVGNNHDIFGTYAVVYHGDYHNDPIFTLYGHMKEGSLNVNVGSTITQKTKIGVMGTSGRSTGVHLHFEIIRGEEYVNPLVSPLLSTPSRPGYISTFKDWISGIIDKIFGN